MASKGNFSKEKIFRKNGTNNVAKQIPVPIITLRFNILFENIG